MVSFDMFNEDKLRELQAQAFRDMASNFGLTIEEAQPFFDTYQQQTNIAMEKYRRAQQQAAQRLAAYLEQERKKKLS